VLGPNGGPERPCTSAPTLALTRGMHISSGLLEACVHLPGGTRGSTAALEQRSASFSRVLNVQVTQRADLIRRPLEHSAWTSSLMSAEVSWSTSAAESLWSTRAPHTPRQWSQDRPDAIPAGNCDGEALVS
jgi:hypothetical protein